MRASLCCFLVPLMATPVLADLPELPITETRLKVGTLVREDVFAGWQKGDLDRLTRAEQNLEKLLEIRPERTGELLSWRGGATLYRALEALDAGDEQEFETLYQKTRNDFEQALQIAPTDGAVRAIVGGSYALFADRLPEKYRADAWQQSYDHYQALWKMQSRIVKVLPNHIRGELLAGLVQSSQRTGHTDEMNQFLDKAIELLPDTGYAAMAERWKRDPQLAAGENITCKSCHSPGRLTPQLKALSKN